MMSRRRLPFPTTLAVALAVSTPAYAAGQASGVDTSTCDRSVRPQDDFYQFVNSYWIRRAEMPPYMGTWSRGFELQVRIYSDVRAILERLGSDRSTRDADSRRLADI